MGLLSQVPPLSATTLALGVVATYFFYLFAVAVYNLYFHPLARFPGPKLRAAFHFPHFVHLNRGDLHSTSEALHKKYGNVVRTRPNVLSFTTAQAWRDIYGTRPGKGQIPKDFEFYRLDARTPPDIIYSNDVDHSRMRKLLSHAFSDAALRDQEKILKPYFELLVTQLKKEADAGRAVDLTQCDSFHALEKGEHHSWVANIFKGLKYGRFLGISKNYPPGLLILKLLIRFIPAIDRARQENMSFTRLKTAARLDMKTDRKDFMNYILKYNDDRGMSRDEIMGTSGILLMAGSETTATLLSGVTYHLLMNPKVLRKAQDEVRKAFRTADEMTLVSTSQLPYMQAVLEEGLRIYPPVPLGLPRRTAADGAWISDYWVPPDTSVFVPQWTANRSKENWTEPEVFAPERWLETPPKKYENDNRAIRQPFGYGPRNCIGRNLAFNEMRSVLARMLWHFDWEICPESLDWPEQETYILWEKHSLKVKLTIRDGASSTS